jgi:hypothetical protein
VFRFRGLEAPDEALYLYKVKCDTGIDSKNAYELYTDAKSEEEQHLMAGVEEDGWYVGGRRGGQIKTGFYIDQRRNFDATPKVFLVIKQNKDALSSSILVVRPNLGKRLKNANEIFNDIYTKRTLRPCNNIQQALKIWDTEFKLADIDSKKSYQFSCPGRHNESMILAV